MKFTIQYLGHFTHVFRLPVAKGSSLSPASLFLLVVSQIRPCVGANLQAGLTSFLMLFETPYVFYLVCLFISQFHFKAQKLVC